jgi:hypothetical protein
MSEHLLEAVDVSKAFGGLKALSQINVTQGRGELLGMIGPNGSGKSTFVNVISGALKPDSGDIRLMGGSIYRKPQHVVARAGIARTFQAVKIFGKLSVLDNVLAGALGHDMSRADATELAKASLVSCTASLALSAVAVWKFGILGASWAMLLRYVLHLMAQAPYVVRIVKSAFPRDPLHAGMVAAGGEPRMPGAPPWNCGIHGRTILCRSPGPPATNARGGVGRPTPTGPLRLRARGRTASGKSSSSVCWIAGKS